MVVLLWSEVRVGEQRLQVQCTREYFTCMIESVVKLQRDLPVGLKGT